MMLYTHKNKKTKNIFLLTSLCFTEPGNVENVTVFDITTSSVTVRWNKIDVSLYRVVWTDGTTPETENVTENFKNITDLTPGVRYTIIVTAVEGNKEGKPGNTTFYTRPVKPVKLVVVSRSTNNLSISWTLPDGRVDSYRVNISNKDINYSNITDTNNTPAKFSNLLPGRVYVITVTAVAGNFSNTSDQFSFATSPTPPGYLIISERTNSSLQLQWSTPTAMNNTPDISYCITYQTLGDCTTLTTALNSTLDGLQSGTQYSISIKTVGPDKLNSTTVTNSTYTLPNPVQDAAASPTSTTSIRVTWSKPSGFQENYRYLVQTYNGSGAIVHSNNISNTSYEVPNLEPGFKYSINITTFVEPDPKSSSIPVQVFSYTKPKAVTNLNVSFVNTTSIQLMWTRQTDYKNSYYYLVKAFLNNALVHNNTTTEETYTVTGLLPGTPYTFTVFTVQEGVPSTPESIEEYTIPAAVSNILAIGTTNSLNVTWTKASGMVSSYSIYLYRGTELVKNQIDLSNDTTGVVFTDLKPGVLYRVEVVTRSGTELSKSEVFNATYPNPPGSIMVDLQTLNSINFTWARPADMDHNQYNFSVSSSNGSYSTQNNWFLLQRLQPGSSYEISVVTVGVWGYKSTPEMTRNFTKPDSVVDLMGTEITTSSVTLNWNQPNSQPHYSYEVRVESVVPNLSGSGNITSTGKKTIKINDLESGSNYTFTVTTRTEDHTPADSVTIFLFTRPYNITDLKASTLSTTSVYLNWTKPYQYKSHFRYLVEATGCGNKTNVSSAQNVTFSDLTPGTNCTFCVTVITLDDTKGREVCTTQYTKPEVAQPVMSSLRSNNSILVTWTKPAGNVEKYTLELYGSGLHRQQHLNFNTSQFLHVNLSAAALYSAVLKSCSGPFCEPSTMVTNATYPNPPGPIEILQKTTSSIELRWGEAPLMSNASSYQYNLTYSLSQEDEKVPSLTTNHTLLALLSGTSYNISVKTVGPMGFESESVYKYMVTTRPHSVHFTTISTEEDNINVHWSNPHEYKTTYRFFLTWQSSDRNITENITISETSHDISELTPGTEYNISVTTETSDGTQSAPNTTSICTNAGRVDSLKCEGPNSGDPKLNLTWDKPEGKFSDFQFNVSNSSQSITEKGSCCEHIISNLAYHSEYNVFVETQSCGKPSTSETVKCHTGVGQPPIPSKIKLTTTKDHNSFEVFIASDLINNSKGPVTHVGILVTSDDEAGNSNLEQYLLKTYDDWRLKSAQAYLATVENYTLNTRSNTDSIVLKVGSESKWKGYTNGLLDPSGTYKYALVVFTNLVMDLNNHLNITTSVFSITDYSDVITLKQNPDIIPIAIGVTLGIFGVLFVILIGFIIYWRRLSRKEAPDIQIQSLGSVAVRVEDFEAYYKKQKADSSCGFAEEFEDLKPVGTAQAKVHALALENKPKNRYNNVLPYDSSRVKLSVVHGSPNEDYINANYMPGYLSRKEYIAAQGPLPATVNDFWRMVWEKNVHTLVMLTRCNEQGRVKCEQYWGPGTKYYENIIVTITSEIPLEDWTIRDFDIKNVKTTEVRSIRHFHFTAWPDHGVPETTELLISFRHLVREHMNQYSRNSPTIVHCSAGVGRTGTFIAIDRLIFQIERENIVDVYGIVHDLRMHRPLMVQTEDQYVFLNQCALDIIRARTGNNVDLIYQNTAAISIYENVKPKTGY
uniref:protein-tyrosine-phosphatase n=1 Tax=Fundulus heteroclitus TaxID=8078 RepID=A0A3Q2PB63_FUNHE